MFLRCIQHFISAVSPFQDCADYAIMVYGTLELHEHDAGIP